MYIRKFIFSVLAIITLLLVACSSGSGDLASVAKVSNPDPTATADPAPAADVTGPTAEPISAPKPTTMPEPTSAAEIALPSLDGSLEDLKNMDMAEIMQIVMGSPELMTCISGALGMSGMMGMMSHEPTSDEIEVLLSCSDGEQTQSTTGAASDGTDPAPAPARPVVLEQTALVSPEGVPWYDGPLFDAHMHMTGVTVSIFDDPYTTSDVLRMMDRHYMVGGVAFWLPPLFGRQSETDLLNKSIGEVDHRLANLMMPPPMDLGFSFGFLGFADGTYTKSLLEEWYPPSGPFDGFGEIAFYIDKLQKINPGDSQLDEVYPLVAESGGVMMAHASATQTAKDWAAVMSQYPEITFLFHGLKDFHGSGPDERAAILELLDTYGGDNLFYTIDAGPLLHDLAIDNGGSIGMDSESGEALAILVDGVGRQQLAEHVYSEYSKEVIDHPGRLMFGTDFLAGWHFEDAGNDVIIDFARRFIGLLPEEIQEDFAYKNGQRVFGKYLN